MRVVLDLVYPGDMLNNILVSVNWPVVLSLLVSQSYNFPIQLLQLRCRACVHTLTSILE